MLRGEMCKGRRDKTPRRRDVLRSGVAHVQQKRAAARSGNESSKGRKPKEKRGQEESREMFRERGRTHTREEEKRLNERKRGGRGRDVLTGVFRLRSCKTGREQMATVFYPSTCRLLAVDPGGGKTWGIVPVQAYAQFLKVFKMACGFPGCFNGAAPAAAWDRH